MHPSRLPIRYIARRVALYWIKVMAMCAFILVWPMVIVGEVPSPWGLRAIFAYWSGAAIILAVVGWHIEVSLYRGLLSIGPEHVTHYWRPAPEWSLRIGAGGR